MSNDALNMDINQQLVLVTGGARGLGEEITKSVLAHGGSVIINYYRSGERAQAIADAHPGKAWAIQADVTDRARRIRGCGSAVPEPVVSLGDRPEPRGRWRTGQGLTPI